MKMLMTLGWFTKKKALPKVNQELMQPLVTVKPAPKKAPWAMYGRAAGKNTKMHPSPLLPVTRWLVANLRGHSEAGCVLSIQRCIRFI